MSTPRDPPRRRVLDDASRALAADPNHIRLAERIADRAARRRPHLADEFQSAAMEALRDAATRFDPPRGDPYMVVK